MSFNLRFDFIGNPNDKQVRFFLTHYIDCQVYTRIAPCHVIFRPLTTLITLTTHCSQCQAAGDREHKTKSLLSSLQGEMASEKSEKYELFYSNSSVYSNFYPASFSDPELLRRMPESSSFSRDDDFRFVNVEQYMHACKVGARNLFHFCQR